jgi:hypothetical protein
MTVGPRTDESHDCPTSRLRGITQCVCAASGTAAAAAAAAD